MTAQGFFWASAGMALVAVLLVLLRKWPFGAYDPRDCHDDHAR